MQDCRAADATHKQTLKSLNTELTTVSESFGRLDENMNTVGLKAVRVGKPFPFLLDYFPSLLLFSLFLSLSLSSSVLIHCVKGEWLDTLDRQRNRASEAKQLIEFFVEFLEGREPEMFRDPARLHEAAGHILKLSTFAAELALDAAQEDQIAKVSSRIESALLDEFAAAQKAQDYRKMTVRVTLPVT